MKDIDHHEFDQHAKFENHDYFDISDDQRKIISRSRSASAFLILPPDDDSLSEDIVSFHIVYGKAKENEIKGLIWFYFEEKEVYLNFDGSISELKKGKDKSKILDKFEAF